MSLFYSSLFLHLSPYILLPFFLPHPPLVLPSSHPSPSPIPPPSLSFPSSRSLLSSTSSLSGPQLEVDHQKLLQENKNCRQSTSKCEEELSTALRVARDSSVMVSIDPYHCLHLQEPLNLPVSHTSCNQVLCVNWINSETSVF